MATSKNTAARDSQKAEALSQDVELTFDGHTYVIERDALDNLEAFEALEDDKIFTAIRQFLGDRQWAEFKDSQRNAKGRVSLEKVESFMSDLMDALGEAGN